MSFTILNPTQGAGTVVDLTLESWSDIQTAKQYAVDGEIYVYTTAQGKEIPYKFIKTMDGVNVNVFVPYPLSEQITGISTIVTTLAPMHYDHSQGDTLTDLTTAGWTTAGTVTQEADGIQVTSDAVSNAYLRCVDAVSTTRRLVIFNAEPISVNASSGGYANNILLNTNKAYFANMSRSGVLDNCVLSDSGRNQRSGYNIKTQTTDMAFIVTTNQIELQAIAPVTSSLEHLKTEEQPFTGTINSYTHGVYQLVQSGNSVKLKKFVVFNLA